MRILVVRVIIGRGTLETDTIILRRSLSWLLVWRARRVLRMGRVRVGRVALLVMWWIRVLRLSSGRRGSQRLAMGSIQHRWLFSGPRVCSILTRSIARASDRCSCIWTIDGIGRHECCLRRHGMEETLLIESHAILTAAIRRAVIARAAYLVLCH